MVIYLAAIENNLISILPILQKLPKKICALSSFYYIRGKKDFVENFSYYQDFLLDSGAFTFIESQHKIVNWEEYLEQYADYIKQYKIKKYFELDIDVIVGYNKVKEYRARLERIAERSCIPVWHKSRGIDEFLRLCDMYDVVSIGGIVSGEIKKNEYKHFPWFINEAHKRRCKIHALGFTVLNLLSKYHFDSVDSSSWTWGYDMEGQGIALMDVD